MRDLLEELLSSIAHHHLLGDLVVDLGAPVLQLATACRCPGVRTLHEQGEQIF